MVRILSKSQQSLILLRKFFFQSIIAVFFLCFSACHSYASPLSVVATTTNMGMLASEIGGEHVRVTVLSPPNRDTHYLSARPSMIAATRRADLVVAVGAELEIGWIPAVLQAAQNRSVIIGSNGYFEAARTVQLINAGGETNRALGDVHPEGNPHFYLDPIRLMVAAEHLAQRLASLKPEKEAVFIENARSLTEKIEKKMPQWQAQLQNSAGVLLFHDDASYLLERFNVPLLGYIEPLPGIPPTASHLNDLVNRFQGTQGIILHTIFQPAQGPNFMARQLNWRTAALATNVPLSSLTVAAYIEMIDAWVSTIAEANAS